MNISPSVVQIGALMRRLGYTSNFMLYVVRYQTNKSSLTKETPPVKRGKRMLKSDALAIIEAIEFWKLYFNEKHQEWMERSRIISDG
jgi:hypothetical protein